MEYNLTSIEIIFQYNLFHFTDGLVAIHRASDGTRQLRHTNMSQAEGLHIVIIIIHFVK